MSKCSKCSTKKECKELHPYKASAKKTFPFNRRELREMI